VRERTRAFAPERSGPRRHGFSEMAGPPTRVLCAGVPVAKESRFSLTRSIQVFQENVSRAGPAATASYSLVGAIVVLGGLGYAADRWFGSAPWGAFAGLMLGLVVGFYELVKSVRSR
jgi:hypothetical protein